MIYRWFTTFTLKNSKNGSFSAPGHKAGLGHLLRTNRVHRGNRRGNRRVGVRGVGGGHHWRLGTGFSDEKSGRLDGITHIYIYYIYLILYVVWNILYKYIYIIILYTSYKYTIQYIYIYTDYENDLRNLWRIWKTNMLTYNTLILYKY